MPGVRRSRLEVQVGRRLQEQRARIGAAIEAMRDRRGWTRIELARRAGLGRMVVSRVERGIGNPDLDALQRLAVALDRPLVVSFGGADRAETPADAGHLAIQELILALGRDAGYLGSFELATRPRRAVALGRRRARSPRPTAAAARRVLEHDRRRRCGRAVEQSEACRPGGLGHREVGRWCDRRAGLGRAFDGSQSSARGALSGGVCQPVSGLVAAMGGGADDRRTTAGRARLRLVRGRGGQDLRLASTEPRRRHRTRLRRLAAPPALPDTPRPPATPDGRATLPAFTAMTAEE